VGARTDAGVSEVRSRNSGLRSDSPSAAVRGNTGGGRDYGRQSLIEQLELECAGRSLTPEY
jgi:hypothetical protein